MRRVRVVAELAVVPVVAQAAVQVRELAVQALVERVPGPEAVREAEILRRRTPHSPERLEVRRTPARP